MTTTKRRLSEVWPTREQARHVKREPNTGEILFEALNRVVEAALGAATARGRHR